MFRTERYKQKSTVVQKINTLEEDDNFDIVYIRQMKSVNELDMVESTKNYYGFKKLQ